MKGKVVDEGDMKLLMWAVGGLVAALQAAVALIVARLYKEVDALKTSDDELRKAISELRPLMITKEDFNRHVDREETELREVKGDMKKTLETVQNLHIIMIEKRAAHRKDD